MTRIQTFLLLAAVSLQAQSLPSKPAWELVMQKPFPDGATDNLRVLELNPRAIPRPENPPGHSHAGPVIGYVVRGEIETHVAPDQPQTLRPGDAFYEFPRQHHHYIRTAKGPGPGAVLVFMPGYGDGDRESPGVKVLLNEQLAETAGQELRLYRLTLPPGGSAEASANANPDAVVVLDGSVEANAGTERKVFGVGQSFVKPAAKSAFRFRNPGTATPATLLLFQVIAKSEPGLAR